MSLGRVPYVPRECTLCLKRVYPMSQGCVSYIPSRCTLCLKGVYPTCQVSLRRRKHGNGEYASQSGTSSYTQIKSWVVLSLPAFPFWISFGRLWFIFAQFWSSEKKCVTEGPMDGQMDGGTDGRIHDSKQKVMKWICPKTLRTWNRSISCLNTEKSRGMHKNPGLCKKRPS